MYGRRRRLLLGAVLALFLGHAAFAAARHPPNDKNRMLNAKGHTSVSGVTWPRRGEAALLFGNGRPAVSPHEQPVPIASLATCPG